MRKQYIAIFMIALFANLAQAQSPNYDTLWKQVVAYESKGLPKSALEVVKEISELAQTHHNSSQQIKSLLYKSKYLLLLEEEAQLKIVADFKSQIENSEAPKKNIMENMLANLYWQYFQQNRRRLYDRTHTQNKVNVTDFRTWDLQTLFSEIDLHYQNSLTNSALLQATPLSNFNLLLQTEKDSKLYRPTLYDFLSHNALDFYKTDENSITQPAYKFQIDNSKYLADTKTFSKLKITHRDSSSLQLKALKIFRELIAFHLDDTEPYALVDVDIQRLHFVKNNATFSGKNTLYLNTLKEGSERYKNHEVSGLYDFERASFYYEQGTSFDSASNEKVRWKLKEALAICEEVMQRFPKSKAAEKCTVLKQLILKPTWHLTAHDNIPIQNNSRVLVKYSNLKTLGFKIFKLSESELEKFNTTFRPEERSAFFKKLKASKEWQAALPTESDYQIHSTEIVVPILENGQYVMVASPNFSNDHFFAFKTFQVTNMALTHRFHSDTANFQLINRMTGTPISGAKVTVRYRENYKKDPQSIEFITDSQGQFQLNYSSNKYFDLDIKAVDNADTAYFNNIYNSPYYGDNTEEQKRVYTPFLFTDRSIYRPGQVVYFKGIATKRENGKTSVYANQPSKVTLKNVNGEVLRELQLKTNDFGSVSGEFLLPNNGLTGRYHIEMMAGGAGSTHFSVEEYKRPKFEVTLLPTTESFKVNDTVTIQGTAIAYAGSSISNAKVVYRVHRNVQFPRWYYWHRPLFHSESQEIAHGVSTTDDQGNFQITFNAIPDVTVDKNSLPIFNYEIIADITDINGETRSASTIVNVGYHTLLANIAIEEQLDKTKKHHKIVLSTTNLNGEFVPAEGTLKIYKLIAPAEVLIPRPWMAPDYHTLSREEFKKLFPHEAYQNEHKPETWEKGELIFETHFDTSKAKEIVLGNIKKWDSGNYVVVLESTDKFGQLVKDEARTMLFDPQEKMLADQQLFMMSTDQSKYIIGQNVILTLGTAAENLVVTVEVEKDQKIIDTFIIPLNDNKKTIAVPVLESDLGGFAIHYSFAAFNSFQSGTLNITVPYPTSELTIETKTFRNKLEPGSDETWSFKIKGPQGDKVSAELLASMYDMSLDQFKFHEWQFNPLYQPTYYSYSPRRAPYSFGTDAFNVYLPTNNLSFPHQRYDQWNWFGFHFANRRYGILIRGQASGIQLENSITAAEDSDAPSLEERVVVGFGNQKKSDLTGAIITENKVDLLDPGKETQSKEDFESVLVRENLQETAFFFPQLQTDAEGNVSFNFTTPEALTKWKLQLLAHTKALESTTTTLEAITQKELMVIPNAPRFLRQGDAISISTKIANLTDKSISGEAVLQLFDALTGLAIDAKLQNANNRKPFSVDAKGNTQIAWSLKIPDDVQAVQYKIIAKSDAYSDGEQNVLPVVSNRMLVTETLPMWIRSNETRTFTLDKLKNTTSKTLENHQLTLEMTSNPAWYAVQALPYLMEYPYDCNEQIFSRYYANALASHIATRNPRIREVFEQWKNSDALLSNLEKNDDLKNILIAETPWLRDAPSETEQKKRIALLFDMNKMSSELQTSHRKLLNNQMDNGAWSWFAGGRHNRFITQHIIAGFGHLDQLKVSSKATNGNSDQLITKAIAYLDAEFVQEYKDIRKHNKDIDLTKDHLSFMQLHYLYMRSFYPQVTKTKETQTIIDYYHTQIQKYWVSRSLYAKGLMALISHRAKDSKTANAILKSLKENSITSDEMGMYWKNNTASWFWYQAPVETQALMIEAFSEITKETKTVDNLKIWLLKNKQTNSWNTTKATTEAVYALLLQGTDWLSVTDMVEVVIGGEKLSPTTLDAVKIEAGTGYYKTSWNGSEITPEMATVTLTKKSEGTAWGALYWQYFEDLDKITFAETPLKLKKKLFLKKNTDTGEQLSEITPQTVLEVGDLVRVRIELRSNRAMEFLHMKDMRAAGFEPINVLSSYKYQDGLGYYESTKDVATNFFFDYLPKGVYIFEYDLRVNNSGHMSNGITTIQSMYAPEFTSHSEGIRVNVK